MNLPNEHTSQSEAVSHENKFTCTQGKTINRFMYKKIANLDKKKLFYLVQHNLRPWACGL